MSEQESAEMNQCNVEDENALIALRREKLGEMRDNGIAYPNDFKRTHYAKDLNDAYTALTNEELSDKKIAVKIAGRMMTRRVMGKAAFCHIQDMSGKIQVYLKKNELTEGVFDAFKHWDLGDILAIEGFVFKTKTGELSIHAESIRMLVKSLRPLPDKYHGLCDQEICYRQRYVDLMVNEATRKTFEMRSKLVHEMRNYFIEKRFLEVETPMMHGIPGGATARPFETWHNTLEMKMYLRIAPELYLKRLLVGGFERVFEINRNFRNEGLSTQHNPEFTMLEFYQAYADYNELMDLTEDLFRYLAKSVLGSTTVEYQGKCYDLAKPFPRMTVLESIAHYNPDIDITQLNDITSARALADKLEVPYQDGDGLGKIQIEIFEKMVEGKLDEPTFITAYPTEVSPLARKNVDNPFITDRFEFFIAGREIANGFSELNDPDDQADRFHQQVARKDAGDAEAMYFDHDYITALEYGCPPAAGEGIGIDRLVMFFTDSPSIRDVLLFPQMRHQHHIDDKPE